MAPSHPPSPMTVAVGFLAAFVVAAAVMLGSAVQTTVDAMPEDQEAVVPLIDVGPVGSRGNPIDMSILNPIRPNTR